MENNNNQSEPVNEPPFYKRNAFIYLAIACIALIATGIAAMFHKNYPGVNLKNLAAELINHDIPPGGNRAVLMLANGKTVVLNEAADGILEDEDGVVLRKTGNGQLRYEVGNNYSQNQYDSFHTISTPKGGVYEITLSDGSVIWLNAASTLKFNARKERKIELSGEAYLKVVRNAKHPFVVVTDRQTIQVSGAHFNVNNYTDQPTVKTSLFEGNLELSPSGVQSSSASGIALKVGQGGIIDHGSIRTMKVDTAEVLAWKNGLFVFENEPLGSIMKKISRWYDVEVIYQHADPYETFVGRISRYEHLSAVLKLLEATGKVHFKIEQGKIFVMK